MEQYGPWKIKERNLKYKNSWITVFEDKVINLSGKDGIYGHMKIKDGVNVLPIDEEGNVYLGREFHYGVGKATIEVIAGGIEAGESPSNTAKRELREELGIIAEEFIDFGITHPLTAYSDTTSYLYLAKKLSFSSQELEDSEEIEIVKVSLSEAVEMVNSGKITSAESCILILKAVAYFKK